MTYDEEYEMEDFRDQEYGTIRERVERGVAWLDANGPEDWHERVVLEDFDMASVCQCVLGFVFSDNEYGEDGFGHGLVAFLGMADLLYDDLDAEEAGKAEEWSIHHGFDRIPYGERSEYHALQSVWEEVIRERRARVRSL